MDTNDWQLEMRRLLEVFERESTSSLRQISRCFVALGRPFDGKFRQYFLNVSTSRLGTSFDTVLFEQYDGNTTQVTAVNDDESASNTNDSPLDNVGTQNVSENENVMRLKIGNTIDAATIEITDSDDDSADRYSEVEVMATNAPQDTGTANSSPDMEINVKRKLKVEHEIELMNLPLVVFDPNKENESVEDGVIDVPESTSNQSEPSSSSSGRKQPKRSDGMHFKCKDCEYTSKYKQNLKVHQRVHETVKPFKCERCDYATNYKHLAQKHQKTHADQRFTGIVRNSTDGLFKCTHCDQRFIQWHSFLKHYKLSHKDNQRLFNCVRCIRRFTQKPEKDRHEVRCRNRRYECHLCKTFVARDLTEMQKHMRTHSSLKPFECAICVKSYKQKCGLNYHLNHVHNRIQT